MTGGLSGQTCSTCLTVEEHRGITVGNTKRTGIRNMRLDYFLPLIVNVCRLGYIHPGGSLRNLFPDR